MTTYTFNKEMFLKNIENFVEKDEIVIFSSTPVGRISGATKKCKGKTINMGFSEDVFKDKETISDILGSKVFGLIVCKKKILSERVQKEFEEFEKTHSSKQR